MPALANIHDKISPLASYIFSSKTPKAYLLAFLPLIIFSIAKPSTLSTFMFLFCGLKFSKKILYSSGDWKQKTIFLTSVVPASLPVIWTGYGLTKSGSCAGTSTASYGSLVRTMAPFYVFPSNHAISTLDISFLIKRMRVSQF